MFEQAVLVAKAKPVYEYSGAEVSIEDRIYILYLPILHQFEHRERILVTSRKHSHPIHYEKCPKQGRCVDYQVLRLVESDYSVEDGAAKGHTPEGKLAIQ